MTNNNHNLPPFRIGHGYDIHAFTENRKLVLGGIVIPHAKGLEGHSDADCLLHALSDAILGAVGLPDIGHYFPNSNPKFKGIDSSVILRKAVEEAKKLNFALANADISILAEEPKLAPHIPDMKQQITYPQDFIIAEALLKSSTNNH